MTNRINLTECEWTKIYSFLVLYRDIRVRDESRCRQFIHAVLWILRTGSQWRQLPIEHGNWNSVLSVSVVGANLVFGRICCTYCLIPASCGSHSIFIRKLRPAGIVPLIKASAMILSVFLFRLLALNAAD